MADKSIEISPQDELLLRWYYSRGISAFQHSGFGIQLEHQSITNNGSLRCGQCKGDGVIGRGAKATECRKCKGIGFLDQAIRQTGFVSSSTRACPSCKGVSGRLECVECDGSGYVEGSSVHCKSQHVVNIPEPDGALMERYGQAARVLMRLSGRHRAILERYYGDVGERWARTDRTRVFALYDATEAGHKLLQTFAAPTEAELSALERIGVTANLDKITPIGHRTTLLAKAYTQANQLHRAACAAWVDAVKESGAANAKTGT